MKVLDISPILERKFLCLVQKLQGSTTKQLAGVYKFLLLHASINAKTVFDIHLGIVERY